MADNRVDKLMEELEAEKAAQKREEERLSEALKVDGETAQRLREERQSKVSGFQLQLDLDGDFGEHTPPQDGGEAGSGEVPPPSDGEPPAPGEGEPDDAENESGGNPPDGQEADGSEAADASGEPEEEAAPPQDAPKKKKKKKSGTWGCLKGIIYGVLVIGISGVLAYFAVTGGIDITGLNKDSHVVDVVIPQGASTQTVAEVLKEGGLIDQPLIFRLYSKLTKADGTYQPGTFSLRPDMGYSEIISTLQSAKPRESVRVTIPEGSTLDDIAQLLSEANVCTAADFFDAVVNGDYSDYDFVADIPTAADGEEYAGRIYRLEGYMFPDTYEFFENSSGETVVRKFLDNFDVRLDTSLRTAIKAQDMTLDEAMILASIIQGEAASKSDMAGVSRVLWNRLNNPEEYPYLQMDSTGDYVERLYPQIDGIPIVNTAYDTYKRKGLPAGPINNPGLDAINALLFPSEDPDVVDCYYFATASDGTTYFSETYEEHVRICRRYNIGIHAQE